MKTFDNLPEEERLLVYAKMQHRMNKVKPLRSEAVLERLTEFIESAVMIHFTKNGIHCVIYQDGDTFTLFGKFGESKGHTHVLDAIAAFEAMEGENDD